TRGLSLYSLPSQALKQMGLLQSPCQHAAFQSVCSQKNSVHKSAHLPNESCAQKCTPSQRMLHKNHFFPDTTMSCLRRHIHPEMSFLGRHHLITRTMYKK